MDAKEFPALLDQIMAGEIDLPNFEEIEIARGVAIIAAGGGLLGKPDVMFAKLPGSSHLEWARYYLGRGQGGQIEGDGYVMLWNGGKGRIGSFAICKHKKIDSPGANHERGWRPGRCELCGLDMTVDSGD